MAESALQRARRRERRALKDYTKRRTQYLDTPRNRESRGERKAKRARFIRARTLWRKRRKEWKAEQKRSQGYVRWGPGKVTREFAWVLDEARKSGWGGTLNGARSGARTWAMQAALYAYSKVGGPAAFPPNGPSRHLRSNLTNGRGWRQAVDVSDPRGLIRHAPVKLHVPYSNEPWHTEAAARFVVPE